MNWNKHCSCFDVQMVPPPGEFLLNITSCLILASGPMACHVYMHSYKRQWNTTSIAAEIPNKFCSSCSTTKTSSTHCELSTGDKVYYLQIQLSRFNLNLKLIPLNRRDNILITTVITLQYIISNNSSEVDYE